MRTPQQTGERLDLMVSRMVERAERKLCSGYNPPYALLQFAHNLSNQGHKVHAFRTGRKALSLAPSDAELGVRVRALLGSIAPGYHLTMINDSVRNQAWDRALRATVRPGMRALEIGSGPGLVALMAARAGAGRVTTCEFDPVVAAVAREIIAHNGYAERIDVLAKSSFELQVGVDLEAPADLFFCDNFSDNMFSFEPLKSIADARARLVKRDAPSLPSSDAVRVALADWTTDARFFRPGVRTCMICTCGPWGPTSTPQLPHSRRGADHSPRGAGAAKRRYDAEKPLRNCAHHRADRGRGVRA